MIVSLISHALCICEKNSNLSDHHIYFLSFISNYFFLSFLFRFDILGFISLGALPMSFRFLKKFLLDLFPEIIADVWVCHNFIASYYTVHI